MNKFLKHLEKDAAHVRLSEAEKGVFRARLEEAMGVSVQTRIPASPYYRWFFAPRSFAFALVLVVLAGGGTAYAAEGSLPGDALYLVKIHINEKVETALALSTQAKVAVNTKLAQRRIAEVETLATRGTLDATTTAQAEANFDYHAAQIVAVSHKTRQRETAVFSAKITASLTVQKEVRVSAASVSTSTATTTPAVKEQRQLKNKSASENSDKFEQHVRASVEEVLNLKIGSSTTLEMPSGKANPPPVQRGAGRLLKIRE